MSSHQTSSKTNTYSPPTPGSSSDPTSLLIPALLLSTHHPIYLPALQRQLTSLLTRTPRYPNNAISHRDAYPSLWADFIYMVPPALAYHAVYAADIGLARDAVQQCRLYCDVLGTGNGCWKHIVNAPGVDESREDVKVDEGLWSTSNGWAAAGMARVLATVRKAGFEGEEEVLVRMVEGIVEGAMGFDTDSSGLLRNRLDDESWFGEVAGTALLAATVLRMAVLEPGVFGAKGKYVEWAMKKMEIVMRRCVNEETGVVAPVVNPTTDDQRTPLDGVSPEAQTFVVLLYAAWRDWRAWVEKSDGVL